MLRALFGILLALFVIKANAKTLVIPLPNLLDDEAALLPSILLGEPGFSFDSTLQIKSLPSTVSLGMALPFIKSNEARSAGWMWALKAGISDYNHITNKIFYPSTYFYEAALGRGTASDDAEFYKGLRGYMEVSLRSERPKFSPAANEVASTLGVSFADNPLFMSIKMGASSTKDGLPIVGQTQSRIAFQARSHLLFSLKNSSYTAWKVNIAGHFTCIGESISCGVDIGHLHIKNTIKLAAAEDLSDISTFAASLKWKANNNLNIRGRLGWSHIGNYRTFHFEKTPSFFVGMIKAF